MNRGSHHSVRTFIASAGTTYLNFAGTTYGTVVSVYTGTIPNLAEVQCRVFPSLPVAFLVQANTTYLIEVSDWHTDGVSGGTLHFTMDFAKAAYNWRYVAGPVAAQGFDKMLVDPANENLWYISATNGLYITRDGGSSWEQHLNGGTRGFAIDPKAANRVYAGSDNRLYRSDNRGLAWTLVKQFATGEFVDSVLVSSIDSAVFVGVARPGPNGIHRSDDSGQTWAFYPFNLPPLPYAQDQGLHIWSLAEDDINGYLYAVTEPMAEPPCVPPSSCYAAPYPRSKDRGRTWENTSSANPPTANHRWHSYDVQVHPVTNDVYYQKEGDMIFVSRDFGDTRSFWATSWGFKFLIDPLDPTRFFVGSGSNVGKTLLLSMDTGRTFREIGPAMPGFFRPALNGTSTKLFAAYTSGSTNGVYVTSLGAPGADLAITSTVTVMPTTVAPGATVTRSDFRLGNQGTALAPAFRIGYYLSTDATITPADVFLGSSNSSQRAAGATVTYGQGPLTIPAGTAPGAYFLGVLLDDQNAVAESNESNNFSSAALTVSGPDLVITSTVTVTPTAVPPGGTVMLSDIGLVNQGSLVAPAFRIGYYLSTDATITAGDVFLGSANSSPRMPGVPVTYGRRPLTIPPGTAPGAYFLGVLVDDQNAVAESNESNNFKSVPVIVQ